MANLAVMKFEHFFIGCDDADFQRRVLVIAYLQFAVDALLHREGEFNTCRSTAYDKESVRLLFRANGAQHVGIDFLPMHEELIDGLYAYSKLRCPRDFYGIRL